MAFFYIFFLFSDDDEEEEEEDFDQDDLTASNMQHQARHRRTQSAVASLSSSSSASSLKSAKLAKDSATPSPTDAVDDTLYCFCRQVSYGEMIACDSETCGTEWFHLECVGLSESPQGLWYCPNCLARKMSGAVDTSANVEMKKKTKKKDK